MKVRKMGHHRPITRSKNKRSRTEENADTTSETLRKILSNGEVTEDDINQLYMITKPACQGCRVNTKDNPNCFCGLIPPPNGSRKSGLWQKTSEIVNSLGLDPSEDLRASSNTPAGLTNLGATCYANSILQCLYMNKSFREGVFSVEDEVLAGDPVLSNLVKLFAQLQYSKKAFVDSEPFIQTLELDNSVQQDSHEFLTLLLSLLEQCLSQSTVPKARTMIQDLFRGGVSHVTRCLKCGKESEVSSKIEDFYGLEINVKGLNGLNDSLDEYLSEEELQGENQYYCSACAMRVDATRSIKLRSLPAVLSFQLKRYIFLPNTTTKKKVTSAFSFPGELNMARRLSECSQMDLIYDLAAVLIHKGSAANSGHYTAHIKDNKAGQWWEFDDEQVSNLGLQPFAPTTSVHADKAVKNEPASSCAKHMDPVVHSDLLNANQISSDTTGVNHVQSFSSSDAYMLTYILRRSNVDEQNNAAQLGEHKMDIYGSTISQETVSPLSRHLLKHVNMLNSEYLDTCEKYKSKKELKLSCITKRRQEVRSVLSEAPVISLEKPSFWISTEWLRHWADSVTPSSIDNTSIQCLHGKVPVTMISSMKRLSAEAWTALLSKYGGGPTLPKGEYCYACIFDMGRVKAQANQYRDQRSLMRELAEASLAGEPLDGKLYYMSKSWLQQWLRRKNIDLPCDADSGPTASIRCPHGELFPELAPGAKRLLVPETLWSFIRQTSLTVKPDDSVGCSTFHSDSETCALCSVEITEAAMSEDSLREFKLKQKQSHEKLAMNKNIVLYPDTNYYLLPSSWLLKWRNYVNSTGKCASSAELDTLRSVVEMMLCEKHEKLHERPPELFWKRGQIFQKSAATDGLTLIAEDDWRLLCEEWSGTESNCVSATIEIDGIVEDHMNGSCEEMQISEDHMNTTDEVGCLSSRPVVKTYPQVCEECIGERDSSELMKKLNYANEDICVCLVHGKEPPKSILEASTSDPHRRTSKRSRKAANGNSINLNVSGSTSIHQLKMMIWESFGVVKENQMLHKGSKVIDGETTCLADANIFPGDTLWVADSKIHENRDIAVNIFALKGKFLIELKPLYHYLYRLSLAYQIYLSVDELLDPIMDLGKAEEGFRGTLLASTVLSHPASETCSN